MFSQCGEPFPHSLARTEPPWLVRIRDVAVAKEKFSSVEVNPWGGLNPETRVKSNVL